METQIWAHRGASQVYLENSLPAFQEAIYVQADGIELDVQRCRDGELVVIHDENLQRLCGIDAYVWQLTYAELAELQLLPQAFALKSAEQTDRHIPRLAEVLALLQGTSLTLNIELKNSLYLYPGMEAEVVALVANYQMEDQVIYSSFNHQSVVRLSQLTSPECVAILTADILHEAPAYLAQIPARNFHPMINSLQAPELIQACQAAGIRLHVWTADEAKHIEAAMVANVAAVITNKPAMAVALRKAFNESDLPEDLSQMAANGWQALPQ